MGRSPLTAPRFLLIVAAVAAAVLAGMALLPHDRYSRFASAASESPHYMRLRWIYERIHFDKTPIDIAFIGTSHTQSAIDSNAVEAQLRTRGLDLHVVNLAIPHLGRDLHYLLTRELLEARAVRELVVEVQDFEPRAPHPAFQRLGRTEDLLTAPIVVNTGYFDNLVRLPRRQLDLFLPAIGGGSRVEYQPGDYEGPHWDDTERLHGFNMTRTATHSAEELDKGAVKLRESLRDKEWLARRVAMPDGCSLLNRYNRYYLVKLLALARENGVHVTFLFLPFFHGPAAPTEESFYRTYGETLTPRAILDDATSWLNVDHFNVYGARRTSQWVGQTLQVPPSTRTPAASTAAAPCY